MKVSLISREISALSRITPTGKHILDILLVVFDNNDLNFLAAFLRRSARRCAFLRPGFLPGLFFFTVRNKHLSPKCIRLLKSECLVLIHVSYYVGQQQASQETDGQKAKSYIRGFLSECKTRSIRAIRNDRQLSHKKSKNNSFILVCKTG